MPDVEEDKPEPDLDELLELFREPEDEKPRRKKTSGSLLIMGAVVLSLVGGWMAAVVANRPVAKHAAPGPPVLPTKVSDRKARGVNGVTLDVVEDYIARCKKGMTAQEVRWVIEDFQKAGLEPRPEGSPPGEFIRQRKSQQRWYLDLLADGLRLDAEQKRAAADKLAMVLEDALSAFQNEPGKGEVEPTEPPVLPVPPVAENGGENQIESPTPVALLTDPGLWLEGERCAPWELCELTNEQKKVTWYFHVMERRGGEPDGYHDPEYPWWNLLTCSMSDPNDEKGWSIGDFSTGCAPDKIGAAASIFPFHSSQKFSNSPEGLSGPADVQAEGCHPAQLKTALLVDPKIASSLLEALDAAEK